MILPKESATFSSCRFNFFIAFLIPNSRYEESIVRDYPVRGRKMSFHIKRRRWVEVETGKSVSRRWDLVAEGTRFSKEFAAFLKDMLGQIPDYGPLS